MFLQSSGICWPHEAGDTYDVSEPVREASVNSSSSMDIEATSHSINTWLASTSEAPIVKVERCEGEAALYSHLEDQSPPRLMDTMDTASLTTRLATGVNGGGCVKDPQASNGKVNLSAVLQSGRTQLEATSGGAGAHQLLGSDDIEVFFSSLNSPSGPSSRMQPGTMAATSPLTTLTNARSAENGAAYNYYQALHQHVSSSPGMFAYSTASPYADYGNSGHVHDKTVLNTPGCYGEAPPLRNDGYGLPPRQGWAFSPYPSSLSLPTLPQYPGEHERPSEGVAYVTSGMGRGPLNGYVAAPPGSGGLTDHGVWGGIAGGLPDLDEGVIGPGEEHHAVAKLRN